MFYDITKRFVDIVGGILGLIIFSPVTLLSMLWVKLVSPEGPVFADTPNRIGKDGRKFRMFKIRSMIPNGQQWLEDRPEWLKKYRENDYKLDPDPRLIKGAKFLRKTSIDEMPQFINVILGQMSLVGPRAYFPFELKQQEKKFPETAQDIKTLLTVKPGITGPWQVGGRSEIPFPRRANIDAGYAKRRSILYDLLIILKTPLAVLSQKGSF
ncbi:sugar transferase [Patescibacteria group bacterium]